MKSVTTLTTLVAFMTMALFTGAMAQCGMHGGHQEGGQMMKGAPAIAPELLQKFNKETKALQVQLIDKQAALKKEFLKEDVDPEAIATIRKSIIDIEKELQKTAKKLGIKNWYCARHLFRAGGCDGMGCGGRGMGGEMGEHGGHK
jgi:hypothetical protein